MECRRLEESLYQLVDARQHRNYLLLEGYDCPCDSLQIHTGALLSTAYMEHAHKHSTVVKQAQMKPLLYLVSGRALDWAGFA